VEDTVIVSVDVPELVIDAGLKLNVMPVAAGDTVAFSDTVPAKPPTEVTVIAHVPLLVPDAGWAIDTDEHVVSVKS
jgi:hypothetical protein